LPIDEQRRLSTTVDFHLNLLRYINDKVYVVLFAKLFRISLTVSQVVYGVAVTACTVFNEGFCAKYPAHDSTVFLNVIE
jgi:hypothetical protein